MAEKILENQVCQACGAKARDKALFCYNCGSSMTGEIAAKTNDNNEKTNSPKITNPLEEPALIPVLKSSEPFENPKQSDGKPIAKTPTKMKSAAELRQRSKLARKTVVVSWEQPQSAPNIWFLMAAFIITLFAVGILFAMLYIR